MGPKAGKRGWRRAVRTQGLTGDALTSWVTRMALRYPSNVRTN